MNCSINVGRRIYSDYLMPDRTADYEALLRAAIGAGYVLMSVRDFIDLGQVGPQRVMVLRHDIDTDPGTARRLFEIEEYGSEASYHFEEIAGFVKLHDIRCVALLRARMVTEIERRIDFTSHPVHWRTNWRESSRHNLTRLRESWSW